MDLKIEEKKLNDILTQISNKINALKKDVAFFKGEIEDKRHYLKTNRSSMKNKEVLGYINGVNKNIVLHNRKLHKINKLKYSYKSPYFAGFTFNESDNILIGKFGIKDDESYRIIVNDWRAPISSVYYDYENGPAFYYVEGRGRIQGMLSNKKQYLIKNSKLVYCFETNINIEDEILKQTLTKNSSNKMKDIVASIQKEQNKIIRKPSLSNLIVQGIAGSGKTSVALHRIAYILYNNRESIKASNVLIFSPNNIFKSYIESILPQLGEDKAEQTSFDEILEREFKNVFEVEKKYELIERLLQGNKAREQNYNLKNSLSFFEKLKEFLNEYINSKISFVDLKILGYPISAQSQKQYFSKDKNLTFTKKLERNAESFINIINIDSLLTESKEEKFKEIYKQRIIKNLNPEDKNIVTIYKEFLKTFNLKLTLNPKLKIEDAISLLYIKNYIFGVNPNLHFKHIVIDELQDYSPMSLTIIQEMYPASKTALGDMYQTVDALPKLNMLPVASKFLNATEEPLKLETLYRCTKEIGEFSNKILNLKNINFVNRSGDIPEIIKCKSDTCIVNELLDIIKTFKAKKYKTIGILTKTFNEAKDLHNKIKEKTICSLLSPLSKRFLNGVVISPIYLSKGLEFDAVVVTNVNSTNYNTDIDKQQLYVACTRALHNLKLIYNNDLTEFLK